MANNHAKDVGTGNGVALAFSVIIDIMAILSVFTAASEQTVKGVLLLYAITFTGNFFEQSRRYKEKGAKSELYLAEMGCILSILLIGVCIIIENGLMDIKTQKTDRLNFLLQQGDNSIFQWGSINITYGLLAILMYPIFIHCLIYLCGRLKAKEINIAVLVKHIQRMWMDIFCTAIAFAIVGVMICFMKFYYLSNNPMDNSKPQYYKYGIVGCLIGFLIAIGIGCKEGIRKQKAGKGEDLEEM